MLPPPFPFKIFVVSSGVLGLPYSRFLAAILAGRAIRYFGEAFLAVRYGQVATSYLRANAANVFYAALAAAALAAFVVVGRRWRQHQRRRRQASSQQSGSGLEARPVEEP